MTGAHLLALIIACAITSGLLMLMVHDHLPFRATQRESSKPLVAVASWAILGLTLTVLAVIVVYLATLLSKATWFQSFLKMQIF